MKYIIHSFILFCFLIVSYETNAVSVGGIIKSLKGAGKVLKKGSDELPDLGKKLEDFKNGDLKNTDKIDDALRSSSEIDSASSIKYNDDAISEVEKLSQEDLLEAHDVKKFKNIDGVLDVVESIETAKNITETAAIIPFLQRPWSGKVFKISVFFNKPEIEERILIKCRTTTDDFYFTALFNKDNNNYLLLSGNFVKKNEASNKISMKRQELLVLKDLEEYLFFSNKPLKPSDYPKKYFLISKNAKFAIYENINNNPSEFSNDIPKILKKTAFKCKRVL